MKKESRISVFLTMFVLLGAIVLVFCCERSNAQQVLPSDERLIIADFEGDDYEGWTVEGTAFGTAPVSNEKMGGMGVVFGQRGKKLVNTFVPDGDAAIGSLTSPEFTIERDKLVFYVGGGNFPGETGLSLLVDGKAVYTASGLFNKSHVGHEGLERRSWDVSSYRGKKAQICIFDKRAGGDWGHIKVDYIYQTDEKLSDVENRLEIIDSASPVLYDRMLFGQFIEHFHRQIYGGIFESGSKLSDAEGFRQDVVEALRELRVPIVRWPGGCFVSAYHWINGVGPDRQPYYDKAWFVEDPNTFGTAEYVKWCRMIGAEPYICTNAGTGTPEEMSDWVEYCNLNVGKYGRMRREHGYEEPFKVKYWSVGNENWGGHEIGAKTVDEWGPLVRESGKMMLCTDSDIKLFAAALPDEGWTLPLLKTAGYLLDYVSIHGYWTGLDRNRKPAPYLECMLKTSEPERDILRTIGVLEKTGFRGRVKIAFDEWNLRGWYHPGIANPKGKDLEARKLNDDNSVYTMADALFSACFLNSCFRRCEDVSIACFSPIVNVRGPLYVYPEGLVKRSTFYVFKMYSDLLEKNYLPIQFSSEMLIVNDRQIAKVDAALTCNDEKTKFALSLVNKDPEKEATVDLNLEALLGHNLESIKGTVLSGNSPDDYNDVGREDNVVPREMEFQVKNGSIVIPPHALCVLNFEK